MREIRFFRSAAVRRNQGFSLVEMMAVVAVMGILATIAMPSYKNYVTKSRAQAAASDLLGMSLALENTFQKTLSYPVYATQTTIPALSANRTASTGLNDFSAWYPAQSAHFSYAVVSSSSGFTVKAIGNGVTVSGNCVLTLSSENVRTAPADNACGMTSW